MADTDKLASGMPAISNALEIALGGGYMRSAGDIGRDHAAVDEYAEGGGGVELSIGYRMSSHLALGVYGTLRATTSVARRTGNGSRDRRDARREGRLALPSAHADRSVGLGGAGWRALWLGTRRHRARLQGIEMTRVQAGIDYRIAPTFAIAPFIGASAAMFIAEDTMESTATTRSRATK